LGDAPNIAARLSSNAGTGEVLLSDSTVQLSGVNTSNLTKRTVQLKGKSEPMVVWVMQIKPNPI